MEFGDWRGGRRERGKTEPLLFSARNSQLFQDKSRSRRGRAFSSYFSFFFAGIGRPLEITLSAAPMDKRRRETIQLSLSLSLTSAASSRGPARGAVRRAAKAAGAAAARRALSGASEGVAAAAAAAAPGGPVLASGRAVAFFCF